MPYSTREKLLAWRETPDFKRKNYERVKAWRAKPGSNAKRAEEARRWREKHPEVWEGIKQRYRANHIEEVRERDRLAQAEYRKTPEYKAASARRKRAFDARKRAKEEQIAGSAHGVLSLCMCPARMAALRFLESKRLG